MGFIDKILFRSSTVDLPSILQGKDVFIVIDKKVEQLYSTLFPFKKVYIDALEENKSLNTVQFVIDQLRNMGADKDSFLVGIGGGVVMDITGFVAAIYQRGVKYALIPTTLQAQVDAAIGGKTGINTLGYKNVVGVFNKPDLVYICSFFLKSLSREQMLCGAAEMLKIFIIKSSQNYKAAVRYFTNYQSFDYDTKDDLESLIVSAVKEKCKIVESDYKEQGKRIVLNLGHTFAHAIEKSSSGVVPHGYAVSIGIVMSLKIAEKMGKVKPQIVESIVADFEAIGLPTKTDIDVKVLIDVIMKSCKKGETSINLIIPEKISSVDVITVDLNKLFTIAESIS